MKIKYDINNILIRDAVVDFKERGLIPAYLVIAARSAVLVYRSFDKDKILCKQSSNNTAYREVHVTNIDDNECVFYIAESETDLFEWLL